MYFVVGSGPAGIACATALVQSGADVTILDSGITLEPERQESVRTLAALTPGQWRGERGQFLREGMASGSAGIPLKLLYGSDFPYRRAQGAIEIECTGVETKPSFALGGLSTVWGSAMLPFRQSDIDEWPISVKDLEPGYRAIQSFLPFSGQVDDLAGLFPLYRDHCEALPMSRQAAAMLEHMKRRQDALHSSGIWFGSSRLAVHSASGDRGCARCGLCMYGCPRELIYSSHHSLPALLATGRLRYEAGRTVTRVEESSNRVVVHSVDRDGQPAQHRGSRVFLAGGVLNTTACLLRSLEWWDRPVILRDSQYFLLPILRFRNVRNVVNEPLHTLAQLFLEILDDKISPYTVHLQTYTYNDLFRDPVVQSLGKLAALFPLNAFLGRLLLFQGYLHSSHSASIQARLQKRGDRDILSLSASSNPETRKRIGKLIGKLMRNSRKLGVFPLPPVLQMGKPGRGFHTGGSFPMARQPVAGESDTLGRPAVFTRIHAVDASVLPSIPATTITYTIMANAYRIGAAVAAGE